MNRRVPSPRTARARIAGLCALVAVFWLAQSVAVAHVVSHLGRDHGAAHSLVCGDCIVSADAGAAPAPALPPPLGLERAVAPPPPAGTARAPEAPALRYRSRAPPLAPN
ncbi:MAG: hypothetical protein JSR73_18815 [Proteobacteria bacterium]|nr:hypothetical protein [Pseudomonadota bacterium]